MRGVVGDNFSMTSSKIRIERASMREYWNLNSNVENEELDVGLGGLGKQSFCTSGTHVHHCIQRLVYVGI